MTVGFRVRDAAGNLLVDSPTRLSRIIGVLSISAGSSGTVTNDGFLTGVGYCIALRTDVGGPPVMSSTMVPPAISFSGNQMSYDAAPPTGDHLLIYGVR